MDTARVALNADELIVKSLHELQDSINSSGPFSRVLCMNCDAADHRLLPIEILELLQSTFPVLDATIHSRLENAVRTAQVRCWEDYACVLLERLWSPLVIVVESNGRWQIACDPDRSMLALSKDAFEQLSHKARSAGVDLLGLVLKSWGCEKLHMDDDFVRRLTDLFDGHPQDSGGIK